ncbi:MAG: hypothetical protein ATN36_03505 [Epulopiscium sp. Nele67-Bin005]|nr:MAG: hypothetical protein ATN36_03505 [Epulopiscium sp. Nele67-Bin005]
MSKCCHSNSQYYATNPEIFMPKTIEECAPVTLMAPVVFDESGINLCRIVSIDQLVDVCQGPTPRTTDILFDGLTAFDLANAETIQLQVVDIDFNFVAPSHPRFSEIRPVKGAFNLSRIILRDINITIAVRALDASCRVFKEGMMTLRFLPNENAPGYDEKTNPTSVAFDLYTPYGISFGSENPAGCNKLVPTINYTGFISQDNAALAVYEAYQQGYKAFEPNNTLAQGISASALAKVIAGDCKYLAIGITLYFRVVYFVPYKFKHEGVSIPPKFIATSADSQDCGGCLAFCEGGLLEPNYLPLAPPNLPLCPAPSQVAGATTCNCEISCSCKPKCPPPRC